MLRPGILESAREDWERKYQIVSDKKHCFPLRPYLICKKSIWSEFSGLKKDFRTTSHSLWNPKCKLNGGHHSLGFECMVILLLTHSTHDFTTSSINCSKVCHETAFWMVLPLPLYIELVYSISLICKMRWKVSNALGRLVMDTGVHIPTFI